MHSKFIGVCLLLFTICFNSVHAHSDQSLESFKTMMGDWGWHQWRLSSKEALWNDAYVQNCAQKPISQYLQSIEHLHHRPINSVPKTIHFIWIGPNPIPEASIDNYISWKKHHPTWEIFLWTDRADRELPVEGMKRRLISDFDFGPCQACLDESDNWSEKSDIIRFSIMYKEGGVYADHDAECVRPFDSLISHFDFVAGYEPLSPYKFSLNSPFVPNTGVFVSRAHHPILNKILNRICSRWREVSERFPKTDRKSKILKVIWRTFDPFAYCVSNFIESDKYRNIILPSCYFHSAGSFTAPSLKMLTKQGLVYAIHRFDSSWHPKKKNFPHNTPHINEDAEPAHEWLRNPFPVTLIPLIRGHTTLPH